MAVTGAVLLLAGIAMAILVSTSDEGQSRIISECRTPLAKTASCDGVDRSWIECKWTFRAEGKPDEALCERFLRLAPGHLGQGNAEDYDDVEKFSEISCGDLGLPERMRCFRATRSEPEATHHYLEAFDAECRSGIVLRACNDSLEEAAAQRKSAE